MSVDIIVLPVHNAMNRVLTLYDQITKQMHNHMSVTILDNGSTDGLGPNTVIMSDQVLFTRSTKKIKNTSFLVTHSILKNPDPNEYILILQPQTILSKDYIQHLVNHIEIDVPDISFGAVGTAKLRSTLVNPDPRVEKYNKWLKTQPTPTFTDAETDITFTKISGKSAKEWEIEVKTDFENGKHYRFDDKTRNWSGIDLKPKKKVVKTPHGTLILEEPTKEAMDWAKKAILTEKQDSIEKVREPDIPRLLEPSSTKPKNRFEKFTSEKVSRNTTPMCVPYYTHENWKNGFISNNILIKRRIFLESGGFDRDTNIVEGLLGFLYTQIEIRRIQADFGAEWSVHTQTGKKSKIPDVDKIVDKFAAGYEALLAETDDKNEKESEKPCRQIIPDSPTQAPLESAVPSKNQIDFSTLLQKHRYKNYYTGEFYQLPNLDPIYATIVIDEENYKLVNNARDQMGSLDNLVIEPVESVRDIYDHVCEFKEDIVIWVNSKSDFEYSYFVDDFKRKYTRGSIVVASNDLDIKVLNGSDVVGRGLYSFCCHIEMLEDFDGSVVRWMGSHVPISKHAVRPEKAVSKVSVGRGTAGGDLQELERRVVGGVGWYGWME